MEIIGEGAFGCVIKKDNDFVVKYGISNEIMNEYKNIKLLPKRDFYFNVDLVTIDKVTLSEQLEIFSISTVFEHEVIRDNQKNICLSKITLPLIYGYDLFDYFTSIISFEEWYRMIACFLELCYKVIDLNSKDKIFHNDLHISNIIYDRNNNIIKIIDFDTLTIGIPSTKLGDVVDLLFVLERLLFETDNNEINNFVRNSNFKYDMIDSQKILNLDSVVSIFNQN